ncbi:MAG: histidine phosphatase family protein [Alphaproteobacteria bacterium]|nr:histidine phosphatase family protein [Alphaproteobacteria bacterium]
MTRVAFLRHGATAWNLAARLQGRADPPLAPEGEARLKQRDLPPLLSGWRCLTSPLKRARQTAVLLGRDGALVDARLVEMDWGAWEGETLVDLRARLGPALATNEARGLDFRPEGGESPRQVIARLAPLLAEIAATGRDTLGITHKGVIRACLALATGWTMAGKAPVRLAWEAVHCFVLDADGRPAPETLNLPLVERCAGS